MAQQLDSQGNVVVNGLSTNLSPSQYAVNIPSTISTNSLTPPATNTAIAQPNYDINGYTNSANSSQAYISSSLGDAQRQAEQEAQTQKDLFSAQNTDVNKLASSLNAGGSNLATSTVNQVYNQSGLNEKQAILGRLNAESLGLGYARDTIPLQLQNQVAGQGVTDRGLAPIQTAQLRNNAIQLASNAYQAAIAKADFDTAKAKADEIIAYKYDTTLAEINAKKTNLENIKVNLTSAERKLADITTRRLGAEQKQVEQKMADEKDINTMIIEATPNAPTDVIARAKKIAEQGGSKIAVAQALGVYGGDFLKNELLKEQIKQVTANINKTKSETIKVDTQTSNLIAQPTGVITAPNGDAIGIPNETLAAIGKLKLGEGQANAVAFVSRMIQASKAIDQQLGEIKPTGGFYETSGYDPTSAGSSIGRFVGSDQSRVYNTNAQDFIRAKLRKESGAAIGQDEFTADAAIYTPSGAGLDEKDLLLAKTKRDEAIKSMIAQAGPAAPYLQQYYEQSKTQGDAFVSSNPQLNSWFSQTTSAVQNSTAQMSGASSHGFVDNQK